MQESTSWFCPLRVIADTYSQAAKDDLFAIVRASKSPASLVFKGKVKFAIDRQKLGALVEGLGTERYSLGKLIKRVKTKREWEASEPTSSSKMMSLAFSRVRTSATWLWRAACKCWICDQHQLHTVMIRLEHRIPDKKSLSTSPSAVVFKLCFPLDIELQRIEVVSRYNDASTPKPKTSFPNQ